MLETAKTNSGLYDWQVNVWDLICENCPKNNRINNDEPINCLGRSWPGHNYFSVLNLAGRKSIQAIDKIINI